ncbi:LPS-assembly protein LptD [Leptothrix discophora]|uniref:LPS-assembly protein LptD n=1 Tax=Leptothrix discophora TaxID=89 RepID=A0ABT9G8Y2_LEPDI|nr:LPS assembly protein LptD [Leptothrix discophora]MDP4302935.1 LPS assembly protein LptD [Leptothrix discophora]
MPACRRRHPRSSPPRDLRLSHLTLAALATLATLAGDPAHADEVAGASAPNTPNTPNSPGAPSASSQIVTPAQACRIVNWRRASRGGLRPMTAPAGPGERNTADRIVVEADRLSGETGQSLQARGDVRLQRDDLTVQADELEYRYPTDRLRAIGSVEMWRGQDYYSGSEIDVDTRESEGWFLNPKFHFARTQAGGGAERIDFLGKDRMVVLGATYSSCEVDPGQTVPWQLSARRVRLDFEANEGLAEGAVLRFFDVPILAWPVLSFPVTDARKSGWLPPHINLASTSSLELGVPYYWNIAPSHDATITPYLSLKRGVAVDTEFRYLRDDFGGTLAGSWLPKDRVTDTQRWSLAWRQSGRLGEAGHDDRGDTADGGWSYDWRTLRVSDNAYWKDGLRGIDSLTPRLLASSAQLRQRRSLRSDDEVELDQWLYARVQHWQVLQSSVATDAIVAPYQREPQVGALWRAQRGGLSGSLQTEANRFSRVQDGLMTGSRAHLLGDVAWSIGEGGWQLTPRASLNAAHYQTDGTLIDGRRSGGRTVPTFSLDSAWTLERPTQVYGRDMTQTLEPRLLYVHTPWRDLTGLPNFDSARLDLNAHSLFSPNAFSGVDRVSEADQVTAGLSSRYLDAGNGAQLASLGIAQRYVLSEPKAAPDGRQARKGYSDLYLLGTLNAVPNWSFDSAVQYSPESRQVERSINSMSYSPGPFRTASLSYRLQRGASEQVALGWQWPLRGPLPGLLSDLVPASATGTPAQDAVAQARGAARTGTSASTCTGTLYGVGRLDYSLIDRRISGAIVGLEYDAGCWIGRVVALRQSTGQTAATTKLMLQLELVGLSRLGSNPLGVLKDNVPGYTLLRDPKADTGLSPGASSGSSTAGPLP